MTARGAMPEDTAQDEWWWSVPIIQPTIQYIILIAALSVVIPTVALAGPRDKPAAIPLCERRVTR